MTIETRLFSAVAALAITATSVLPMLSPVSSAAVPANEQTITRTAAGRPILLGRMVVSATPL